MIVKIIGNVPGNYCPISLLSCLGKLMERCLQVYVQFNFFMANKILFMKSKLVF